ncbi:unnamed protein product [Mytilus coruscus]|uniref:DUF4806 domain-containing protein n=1 Tax=Mytilus coruscus TaxID=42192 RepID=A0A6J8ADX8_MYTCO|nr:unnamed protein product [Mytilus coruscus]
MKHVSSPTNNISEDETNDNLEETAQKETNQDDNSESTEDYIPNIPIVQGPPEVPAIDQGRKHLEDKENKEKYKSYIKVSRWTVQPTCSKIDVHESLFNKPNKLPANRAKTPLRCKRKLFASEVSKQEIASCRKKTTLDMVVQLLGPSSDVDDCLKYRELKLKHPGHKSFISAFDQSFSKLQIEKSTAGNVILTGSPPSSDEKQPSPAPEILTPQPQAPTPTPSLTALPNNISPDDHCIYRLFDVMISGQSRLFTMMANFEKRLRTMETKQDKLHPKQDRLERMLTTQRQATPGLLAVASDDNTDDENSIPEEMIIPADRLSILKERGHSAGNFASLLLKELMPHLFGQENLRNMYSWNGGGINAKREV